MDQVCKIHKFSMVVEPKINSKNNFINTNLYAAISPFKTVAMSTYIYVIYMDKDFSKISHM